MSNIKKHKKDSSKGTMDDKDYKWLIKEYKIPPYSRKYGLGYVRALYDWDLINRNQWNYLCNIVKKYNTER